MSDADDPEVPFDDPPRDHGVRNAIVAIVALCAAAAGAWAINARFEGERRDRELRRAAGAWADLSRCLAGERYHVGEVARVARHVEVGVPRSARFLPAAERARQWPWRCAPYARTMTVALFQSHSDDVRHRLLNEFASLAATELERGALRTGPAEGRHYLDELFAAAGRAELPLAPGSRVALPPPPARFLDPSRARPLFRGAGGAALVAEEPLEAGALRVVLGTTERRFCDFDRALDAPDCQRVASLDRAERVLLTGARYPRMPGYVVGGVSGVGTLLHPGHPGGAPVWPSPVSGALRTARDAWLVAWNSSATPEPRYEITAQGLSVPVTPTPATPPRMFGGVVLGFVALPRTAPSGDAGVGDASVDGADGGDTVTELRVLAGSVDADGPLRWTAPFEARGVVRVNHTADAPIEARARGCRTSDADVIAVYGDDGRALVLRSVAGRFDPPLSVDAHPGGFTCSDGRVRLAWYTDVPRPVVHVATCSATACEVTEAPAPTTETRPRVIALGDRVLMAYSTEGNAGLRYRLGPLASIADERETIVFDDGAHDGVDLEAPPTVLARGDVAVLLVTRKDGARETWAIRVEARGYRALRLQGDP